MVNLGDLVLTPHYYEWLNVLVQSQCLSISCPWGWGEITLMYLIGFLQEQTGQMFERLEHMKSSM